MLELTEWAKTEPFGPTPQPWLLLGKGPTFSRFDEVDTSGYLRITLNHVVQRVDTDIAHLVDLDVLADCCRSPTERGSVTSSCRAFHTSSTGPQERALEDLFDEYPVLAELERQQRLIWYNLEYSAPVGDAPVLTLRSFASEPALQILGRLGVEDRTDSRNRWRHPLQLGVRRQRIDASRQRRPELRRTIRVPARDRG